MPKTPSSPSIWRSPTCCFGEKSVKWTIMAFVEYFSCGCTKRDLHNSGLLTWNLFFFVKLLSPKKSAGGGKDQGLCSSPMETACWSLQVRHWQKSKAKHVSVFRILFGSPCGISAGTPFEGRSNGASRMTWMTRLSLSSCDFSSWFWVQLQIYLLKSVAERLSWSYFHLIYRCDSMMN